MWHEAASEIAALILSSAGIAGTAAALVFGCIMKRAKNNAEKRRDERLKLDILRLEGEEKLSGLLFELIRYSRGIGSDDELIKAEKDYSEYLEKARKVKNEIIGFYTAK